MTQETPDRSKRVLSALIREYITTGEPVASSLLVTAAGLGVSSATVRSIVARLEEDGYVQQPHTSAGRIPTDRGYRFYVNLLLESKRSGRTANAVEARLRRDADPLVDSRVLVVIVARGGHVVQKVIDTGEPLSHEGLRHAANYLNTEFSGLPLNRAREAVLERMNEERQLYDALSMRAMQLASSTFNDLPQNHVLYVDGAASLLGEDHGLAVSTMHALLEMIEEKQRLVSLLNEYIDGVGLTVVIGAEHLDPSLRPFSLVASTYADA